jgi:hypothetical protein
MKISYELDLDTFEAWSGAVETLDKIKEADKVDEMESLLEEVFPDGCTETELNDYLWFDDEQILQDLGIIEDEEEDEEIEEDEE